jgi:protein-S-isoprenylcysteine O-methyltransferase Ste14
VYARIQHPLYTFLDLLLIGVIIGLGWHLLLLAWIVLVSVHVWEARREERVLSDAFGSAYRDWEARTWF